MATKAEKTQTTVGEILEAHAALRLVGQLKLDAKLAYRLAHNRRVANEVVQIFEFAQNQVIQELAEKDEEGNVVKTPLPNGLERVKFGKSRAEAEARIEALRKEAAPMDDFRHLEMADVEKIGEAAESAKLPTGDDFPVAEVVYGLFPLIKEK